MLVIRFVPAGALICTLLVGCAEPHGGRIEVQGKITLNKQPLKDGTVSFEPLDGQETRATALLTDGAYKIERQYGLRPGRYLIRVSSGDGKTPVNPVDDNNPPGPTGSTNIVSKDRVPKEWNVDSNQERTVTKENPNTFDFDIP